LVIQLFLIGIGGATGYLTVALCGIEHRLILFLIGIGVLVITLLLTVFSIKEKPFNPQGLKNLKYRSAFFELF